jgi:hypothetical protein
LIIWGFAFTDERGQSYWCAQNYTDHQSNYLDYPIPVSLSVTDDQKGKTSILASKPSNSPNLHVSENGLVDDEYSIEVAEKIYCLHFKSEYRRHLEMGRTSNIHSPENEIKKFEEEVNKFIN